MDESSGYGSDSDDEAPEEVSFATGKTVSSELDKKEQHAKMSLKKQQKQFRRQITQAQQAVAKKSASKNNISKTKIKKRKRSQTNEPVLTSAPLPKELLEAVAKQEILLKQQKEENDKDKEEQEEEKPINKNIAQPPKKQQKIMPGGLVRVQLVTDTEEKKISQSVQKFLWFHFWDGKRIPRMNANLFYSERKKGPAKQFVVHT